MVVTFKCDFENFKSCRRLLLGYLAISSRLKTNLFLYSICKHFYSWRLKNLNSSGTTTAQNIISLNFEAIFVVTTNWTDTTQGYTF